jgi:hypothetical protein
MFRHNDVINQMKASATWMQTESQPLGHCAACDHTRSLRQRNNKKRSYWSNEEKEKWIEYYFERETAGAKNRGEDAEAAIWQAQEDTEAAEHVALMTREFEKIFHQMMVAKRDSLSEIPSSNDGEDEKAEADEDTLHGQLSEDDEPGWVIGTIPNMVQQLMERCR